ncbi:DNA repair protein RecN [Exiguobacterium sp. RIT452]|uniref:DNA repair protein RecN n=1 Tax=Exiguobacterium undae TaxID=169177 RepID=A0ABX2VCT5_9BACL|nr:MULTISPECIES: DNA repair protein RecN [Exiguobacterium]OAN16038.1 DNA repair protein RecN [Exiguobacterium undae]RJP01997.1 DNA repair protein RecN [Exiguobacterium sp. RIT452]
MLAELSIKQFAIIDQLQIDFKKGMTVLTGETGAGKSIVLDAIGLLIGGRGSAEFVRYGEDKAELEGLFMIEDGHMAYTLAEEYGIDMEDGMIILRRDLFASGKSVCRVNHKLVTLTILREFGRVLVDLHGQHEHQHLMESTYHQTILDDFGQETITPILERYQARFEQYEEKRDALQALAQSEQELAQRIDLLSFQTEEIDSAKLRKGEEEDLLSERNRLANFEKLHASLSAAYDALHDERRGIDSVGDAMRELQQASSIDEEFSGQSDTLANAFYALEEVGYAIRDQLETLEFDSNRLDEIELRLSVFQQLKRKYGATIEEVIAYGKKISVELDTMTNRDERIEKLKTEVEQLESELFEIGGELSQARRQAALLLGEAIHLELRQLYMEKARFEIRFLQDGKTPVLRRNGIDFVEFYIMTNAGEPFKSLGKVASGGELSRIMLGLKSIFSRSVGVASIIFDEVDTGVSGRVAQAMAEKIYRLSIDSQVLCITHLPQVASIADQHLYIRKIEETDRTTTQVNVLTDSERGNELGRMISGTHMTDLTLRHAEELMEQAMNMKESLKNGV